MVLMEWTPNFSVGVTEIDEQHKKLVEMLNLLYDAMTQGKSKEVLSDILVGLIGYTGTHFGTEEKYFDQFNYPEKETHKSEHKKFVEKVTAFKSDFDSGNASVSIEIMNFLKDWLVNHIQGTDKRYSAFFNEHGLK